MKTELLFDKDFLPFMGVKKDGVSLIFLDIDSWSAI